MKYKKFAPLCLAAMMSLSACTGETTAEIPEEMTSPTPVVVETPAPTPEPTPEPEPVGDNPLTGLPMEEEWVDKRPLAIMLNNLKEALPQQGNSKADIIYECIAEGGITRMLGVYQDLDDLETVGSIRSARSYYIELSLAHDAIFIHAGGSEEAYANIRSWGVTALDGVNGPYMSNTEGQNLMWRDSERRNTMSLEHTAVTNGEALRTQIPDTIRRDHEEDYTYHQTFLTDGTPENGETATTITVPFSNYKTGVFHYDEETALYMVEEYGQAYVDGNSGDQVGVTNVIVLFAKYTQTGDSLGHVNLDLAAEGEGYFACGGEIAPITWSRAAYDAPLYYFDQSGESLELGQGTTYVNIVPLDTQITY